MALVITNDSQRVLFREDKMRTAEELSSATIIEEKVDLAFDFGVGNYRELCFEGLHIAYGKANVFENLHMFMETPDTPTMVSQVFVLHGDITAYLPGTNACQYTSLEHNLVYNPNLLEKNGGKETGWDGDNQPQFYKRAFSCAGREQRGCTEPLW